jgi:hypothetical protein
MPYRLPKPSRTPQMTARVERCVLAMRSLGEDPLEIRIGSKNQGERTISIFMWNEDGISR